jgi:hypothetical protein
MPHTPSSRSDEEQELHIHQKKKFKQNNLNQRSNLRIT